MRLARRRGMRLFRPLDLGLACLRLVAPLAALAIASRWEVQAAASLALFLASFAFAHDLAHGALGLPRRVNTIALMLAALPMLVSGHAMRLMHLRHHARPLAPEDVEGDGARRSFVGALVHGPSNAIALRVAAFRGADGRGRARQRLEQALVLGLVAIAVATRAQALVVHVVVAVAMNATMALWAAHVPHHAPAWVTRAAARLAFLGSPVLLSLAFHEEHHRLPHVPCRRLGELATAPVPRPAP